MPSGETRLELLLSNLQPALDSEAYVFCSLTQEQFQNLAIQPRGTVREREGVTVILTQLQADNLDLAYEGSFACITLSVHSSLEAVGLIAAVASALAQAGIGVNPLAGYYHDHLFVPWERRGEAMTLLLELQQSPHQGRSTTHPRL
ncbi:MAG: ACT domain-containing protein [Anaerolineales bacterium]